MKALIVAAGKGNRINANETPKPLLKCFDKHIIEYVINNLKLAGVEDFYIVVGFMGEKIKEALGDGSRYGIKINYIENPEYEKANGLSVYKAKDFINEPFILSMSDHILHPKIVSDFVSFVKEKNECYLCTDKKIDSIQDIADATKVLEEDCKITNIHKELTEFNVVDCGLFYLTPRFFSALEASQSKGDFSITGGVQELANLKKMFTFDIGDSNWIDIDTEEDLEFLKINFKEMFGE